MFGAAGMGSGGGVLAPLARRLEAEQERWFCWLPVCIGGGIAAYFALPAEPSLPVAAVPVVVMLAWRAAGGARTTLPSLLIAALFAASVWLSSLGTQRLPEEETPTTAQARMIEDPHFEQVRDIVAGRCSMCHAAEPGWPGIDTAPRRIVLETDDQIARTARDIYLQAGLTDAMPPANVSFIEPEERAVLRAWFEGAGRS